MNSVGKTAASILFAVFFMAPAIAADQKPSPANDQIKTRLERLLQINYRVESYVEEFEQGLDQMIANPTTDKSARALAQPAYYRLNAAEVVMHEATDQLVETYQDNLETLGDFTSGPEARAAALQENNEISLWFAALPEVDQLQLLDVAQQLIASQGEDFVSADLSGMRLEQAFAEYTAKSSRQIEEKIKSHTLELRDKAMTARAWHDEALDAIDADTRAHADEFSEALAEEPKQGIGPLIYPSSGPNGNVDGHQLPAGIFVWTFDDGPHPTLTAKVLDLLTNYHDSVNKTGTATFFRILDMVHAHPSTVELEKKYPFHMNNHSWTHPNFAAIAKAGNFDDLRHEVVESSPELQKAFGSKFRFFRCPGGACLAPRIPEVREMIADQGLIHAYWLVDTLDWALKNQPQRVADGAIKQMQIAKRGVILIHDIHPWSVEAASIVFNWIRSVNDGPVPIGSFASQKSLQEMGKIRLVDLETAVDMINKQ